MGDKVWKSYNKITPKEHCGNPPGCSGWKHQRFPGKQQEQFDFSSLFLFCSLVSTGAEPVWVKWCNLNISFSHGRDLSGAEGYPYIPFCQDRNLPWTDRADLSMLREGCAGNIPLPIPLGTLPAPAMHSFIQVWNVEHQVRKTKCCGHSEQPGAGC